MKTYMKRRSATRRIDDKRRAARTDEAMIKTHFSSAVERWFAQLDLRPRVGERRPRD